jgi:[acyl-carrier-protein] S-malonyltransferase
LYRPVRWMETIASFVESGVTHIVECGPGKVLAGLNRRMASGVPTLALTDADSLQQALSAVRE